MISFIVPAHDEEQHLAATLRAIAGAMAALGEPFETIVVDDASTDRTAAIAEAEGARVVRIAARHIAAARNAGARVAGGDVLFFVDADTLTSPEAVRAGLDALRAGAAGGGCVFRFDGALPRWARALYPLAAVLARAIRLVGGCFLFCHRAAFDAVGGFDERYFAAEETAFIRSLKRVGRFVVPRPTVVTSGRKLRALTARATLGEAWRWAIGGPEAYRARDGLEIWYGPRRRDPHGPS